MTENEITIIAGIKGSMGLTARIYYYQGNIFRPMQIHGRYVAQINIAVKKFIRENREMIIADRSDPGYRSLVQLFDDQMRGKNNG